MKKYLFLTLCLCVFLFPFIGNAKTITKADLEAEAESMLSDEEFTSGYMGISDIVVSDDNIIITTKENKSYTVNYVIDATNNTIETNKSFSVEKGLSKDEYNDAITQGSFGMLVAHVMISKIQGVESLYDSSLYFSAGGSSTGRPLYKNNYAISYEGVTGTASDPSVMVINENDFSNQIVALATHMFDDYSFEDENGIYRYSTDVTSSEDTATILMKVVYNNDADFSKMNNFTVSGSIDLGDFDFILELGNDSVNAKAKSPKTSTNVKVPNTALNISNLVYLLGLITILIGLLSVNKVIKRKSN